MLIRRAALICLLLLAAAAPDVPPSAPPSKMPPSVGLQHVAPEEAMAVLGHTVVGPEGKPIARLIDVLVDDKGQPVAALLDFGGFLGLGNRKIAVRWGTLRFAPAETTNRITLMMTPDEIKAAPQYKDATKPAQVVAPAAALSKPVPK